jgi:hypothetical protein
MGPGEAAHVSAIVALDQTIVYDGKDGAKRPWIVDRLYLGWLDVEAVLALDEETILRAYEATPKEKGPKGRAVKVLCVVKLKPPRTDDPGADQGTRGGGVPADRPPAQARTPKRRRRMGSRH